MFLRVMIRAYRGKKEVIMYEFNKDCMIGIKELDDEHEKLFKILNEAIDLNNYLEDITQVSKGLIDNLRDYADTHFAHEEAHMERIHDPELSLQRKEHAIFAAKINEFELDESAPEVAKEQFGEFISYLVKWLYHHIMSSDMMIGKVAGKVEEEDIFAFTQKYMTGIDLVDKEHRKLFEIIAQTKEVIDSEFVVDKYDNIMNLLEQLKDYTEFHFADEEKLMENIGYPALDAQRRAHAAFVEKLVNIDEDDIAKLEDSQQEYLDDLIAFLVGWLSNHIIGMDKKIGEYIRDNNISLN